MEHRGREAIIVIGVVWPPKHHRMRPLCLTQMRPKEEPGPTPEVAKARRMSIGVSLIGIIGMVSSSAY